MENLTGRKAGGVSEDALEIGGRPCLQYLISDATGGDPRGKRRRASPSGCGSPGCPGDWRTCGVVWRHRRGSAREEASKLHPRDAGPRDALVLQGQRCCPFFLIEGVRWSVTYATVTESKAQTILRKGVTGMEIPFWSSARLAYFHPYKQGKGTCVHIHAQSYHARMQVRMMIIKWCRLVANGSQDRISYII